MLLDNIEKHYPKVLAQLIESYLYRPEQEDLLDMVTLIAHDIRGDWRDGVKWRIRRMQELCLDIGDKGYTYVKELDRLEHSCVDDGRVLRDSFSLYNRYFEIDSMRPWIFWPNQIYLRNPFYHIERSDTEEEWRV